MNNKFKIFKSAFYSSYVTNSVKFEEQVNGSLGEVYIANFNNCKRIIKSNDVKVSGTIDDINIFYDELNYPKSPKVDLINSVFSSYNYIEGFVLKSSNFNKDLYIRKMASELADIHKIKITKRISSILDDDDLITRLDFYKNIIIENNNFSSVIQACYDWLYYFAINYENYEGEKCLIHGDFRSENIICENFEINGVVDWEFARISSYYEDIGWFTSPAWRRGVKKRGANGLGNQKTFIERYEKDCSVSISPEKLKFWQAFSLFRWYALAGEMSKEVMKGNKYNCDWLLSYFRMIEIENMIIDDSVPDIISQIDKKDVVYDYNVPSFILFLRCIVEDIFYMTIKMQFNIKIFKNILRGVIIYSRLMFKGKIEHNYDIITVRNNCMKVMGKSWDK